MSLPEFGDGLPPEPVDIDRIMDTLAPEHCRGCKFLEFSIGLMLAFESSTGGPWGAMEDVEEHCTGYEGEVEPSGIESVEVPGQGRGLLFPLGGDDLCPYSRYLNELNAFKPNDSDY